MRRDAQYLVNGFWDDNKRVPAEYRNKIATEFIETLFSLGYTLNELRQTVKLRHPMIRRKDMRRRHTILTIVADFILNVKMIEEREREYPVINVEAKHYRERERRKKEIEYIDDLYSAK